MGEWDGKDRRHQEDPTSLVLYRLDKIEVKLDGMESTVSKLLLDHTTFKVETQATARAEGKVSGAIWGIVGSIVVGVIGTLVQIMLIK